VAFKEEERKRTESELKPKPILKTTSAAEPQSLGELKTWMEQELATLRKELAEERRQRRELEDKVYILEGKLK